MHSYLTNWNRCMNINETLSEMQTLQYGVPQGTVVGPILFNRYLNDFLNWKQREISSALLMIRQLSIAKMIGCCWVEVVKNDLSVIFYWFSRKLLTINYSKNYYIAFTSYNRCLSAYNKIQVQLRETIVDISSVQNLKHLGIYFYNTLKSDIISIMLWEN